MTVNGRMVRKMEKAFTLSKIVANMTANLLMELSMVKVGQLVKIGTYYFSNGETYEGEWVDGKMEGQGF